MDVSNITKLHAYPTFASEWNNSVGLDDIGAKKKSKIRAGVFYTNSTRLNGRSGDYANRIDQNRVSLRVMF